MIPRVEIHYHRPPARTDVYRQWLVADEPGVKVTYQPSTPLVRPLEVDGTVILEPGSPAVWFTFPGAWHDIGRFHTADGRFTGLYANVLTPCRLHDAASEVVRWDTTDLFLDVWRDPRGGLHLLDEDDLRHAHEAGAISSEQASRARREAEAILAAAARGAWPPPVVDAWTLERARDALLRDQSSSSRSSMS